MLPVIETRGPGEPSHSQQAAKVAVPAVLLRDVVKSFPVSLNVASWARYLGRVPRRTVLHDVSLSVRPGELFGLLGPNGAGKTTLLKMLATLCIPDRGGISIAGIDAAKRPMAVKDRIGLCTSEERSFYYRLTARENLRFFGALAGLFGKELDKRIEELASLVDLTFALDRRFDTFSSGMRQRLSLTRGLLADPDIVFLDEPTRAVDPIHALEIRAFVRNELVTRRGKTVILATNSLEEAWAICDRVAILREGRIVAVGSPNELDTRFARLLRYRIALDGSPEELVGALRATAGVRRVHSLRTIDGNLVTVELDPDESSIAGVLRSLAASGAMVKSFQSLDPQPLDVFAHVTQYGINS